MAYIGNTATTQAFTPAVDYFNGDGATVAFTLSKPVASVAQVQAVIENVPQNPGSAYTVSGNTITFTSAPPSGTANIYVYYTSPITQVIAPGQGTVGTEQIKPGTIGISGTSSQPAELQLFEDTDNGTNYVALKAPASIASDLTLTLPSADGTSGQALTTNGSGVLAFATIGTTVDTQTFNSSGTWTKPAGCTFVQVIAFGGGGGGGSASAGGGAGGGGGGGAATGTFLASDFGSTVTVTVGTGGAGGASANTNGTAGGDSSFGTVLYARGGGAGATNGTGAGAGGGGGGAGDSTSTAGTNGNAVSDAGKGGAASSFYAPEIGSRIGAGACDSIARRTVLGGTAANFQPNNQSGIIVGISAIGSLMVGGGGGGGRGDSGTTGGSPGGNAAFGGGAGGGASDLGAGGAAGTGGNGGGNGGAGGGNGGAPGNGTAPGGGGGGSEAQQAGNGADGRVIVYSW